MKRVIMKLWRLCLLIAAAGTVSCNKVEVITVKGNRPAVLEYSPAPGQFINDGYVCLTMDEAVAWAQNRLDNGLFVSLGTFGGYIVLKMENKIENGEGYDFAVCGNPMSTSSEPGIVWVSENGVSWYRLKGDDKEYPEYSVTYFRPSPDGDGGLPAGAADVKWKDSDGNEGTVQYLPQYHAAPYFPLWIDRDEYTLTGTRLDCRAGFLENGIYSTGSYPSGYADNWASDMETMAAGSPNRFDIGNAVDNDGNPVNLSFIQYIKVQSAVISQSFSSPVGEISTEITSVAEI